MNQLDNWNVTSYAANMLINFSRVGFLVEKKDRFPNFPLV